MSFDGNLIHHLVDEWNTVLPGGRIQKIYQISRFDVLFSIHANRQKHQLLISTSPRYARCYLTNRKYDFPSYPPSFGMFLRKQLEGGVIQSITQHDHDRIIDIDIKKRNELGDLSDKHLMLEMMGRYANIIVVGDDGKILDAIKHNVHFESTERTIFPGAVYELPPQTKLDPTDQDKRRQFLSNPDNLNFTSLLNGFMGMSPLSIKEILHRYETKQGSLDKIFDDILTTTNPTYIHSNKDHFYHTDLTHLDGERTHYDSLNALLDDFYHERDKKDIVTQYAKDLKTFLRSRITRILTKIDKLGNQLQDTSSMDIDKIKGELIKANLYNIVKGQASLETINYYDNQPITIALNPTKTPVENSERYFKRYKKKKHSIPHINKQINDAKKELEYFYEIESQLDYASLRDIEEIREELIERKYLHSKHRIKKKKKPNYVVYLDDNGTEIFVGKNNLQNEYLTHKIARHNDVWFHVQNAPGSHVIVRASQPLCEDTIRLAANLASLYSKQRTSSSVAVDYTDVKFVKKIPGKVGSFVRYTNQKTIYIDPNEEQVRTKKKKA